MRWQCARGCGASSSKQYASAAEAARYARELDREDRDTVGRRAPLSLLPLRLARRLAGQRPPPLTVSGSCLRGHKRSPPTAREDGTP